jgi:hypothetical protein
MSKADLPTASPGLRPNASETQCLQAAALAQGEGALGVQGEQDDGRVGDDGAEVFLAAAQILLGAAAFGHVHGQAHDTFHGSLAARQGAQVDLEDVSGDLHGLVHVPAFQGPAHGALQGFHRGRPGEHGLALELKGLYVHGFQAFALGHGEGSLFVEGEQDQGRVGQHGAEDALALAQGLFALAEDLLAALSFGDVPGRYHAEVAAPPGKGIGRDLEADAGPVPTHARRFEGRLGARFDLGLGQKGIEGPLAVVRFREPEQVVPGGIGFRQQGSVQKGHGLGSFGEKLPEGSAIRLGRLVRLPPKDGVQGGQQEIPSAASAPLHAMPLFRN